MTLCCCLRSNKASLIHRSFIHLLFLLNDLLDYMFARLTLLGLKDTVKLNLVHFEKEVHEMQSKEHDLFEEYSDVFGDEIGKVPITYRMKLN